jgi:hypothetical protein
MKTHAVSCVLTIAAIALPAAGRWPTDPSQNLRICGRPEMQFDTRVLLAPDNGWYVSWVDRGTGWDIYVQRLDAAGTAMWPPGGVLAATRSGLATQGVDVAVDGEDHIVIAFHDVRDGFNQIVATRISPTGEQVWGADGVQLTDVADSDYVGRPQVATPDDGEIVVAWSRNRGETTEDLRLEMQRLLPDGSPIWNELLTLTPQAGAAFWLCDLLASEDGAVIASWVHMLDWYAPRHIWAQKFDREGSPQWGSPSPGNVPHLVIFDAGSIQYGSFPVLASDGAGGTVFSWYRTYPGPLQVFAQHVGADGTELFPHNGAAVSIDPNERTAPRACFNPDTGETFVFWVELVYGQSIKGVYGQKLDAVGNRQWGDEGVEIVRGSPTQHGEIRALPYADGAMVLWIEEPQWEDCYLNAVRLDGEGAFAWNPATTVVSSVCADKDDLAVAMNEHGVTAAAWSDGRHADDDVYAQNITAAGAFGVRPGDADGDGIVDVADLILVLGDWGCGSGYCPGDLNQDGAVNVNDLLAVLSDWG